MNSNILNNTKPTWKDAAVIALVLMTGLIATMFLPQWSYEAINEDVCKFGYELLRFSINAFITTFISLTGLTYVTQKKPSEQKS